MARVTRPQLKAICRQRRLSTKGTKRDLRAAIKKDDQKNQHQEARRRSELKQLEKEFRRLGTGRNETGEGRPVGSISNVPGSRGSFKRASQRLRAIEIAGVRVNTKGTRRSQNRYQELLQLSTEEREEKGREGEIAMDTLIELPNTSTTLEQNVTINIALRPNFPNYDREIDDITLRISNLESPFLYLDGAGQAMNIDFRDAVRDWGAGLVKRKSFELPNVPTVLVL